MRVVYSGPSQARWLPDARVVAQRGVPVEVPRELGLRLIEQPDWNRAPRRRAKGATRNTRRS